MRTVYIDVLFLINFALDYMTLCLGGGLFHFPMRRWRLILVSCGMAFYALWALLFCGSYPILVITAIAAITTGCWVTYQIRSFLILAKTAFVCSGIGALLGAGVYLLYGFISRIAPHLSTREDSGTKVLVFILLAAVSGILIYFGNRLVSDVRGIKSVDVRINLEGIEKTICLLVDSGNFVSDPLSGRRVIILSLCAGERYFGSQITSFNYLPHRRRCLCITTAAGKRMITAFLPREVKVKEKKIDALIAITEHKDFHGYDGIFPAALLP